MEMELPEEAVEGINRIPAKKDLPRIKEDDYFSFLTLLRPQVTESCWVQLGKKGGWSSKR